MSVVVTMMTPQTERRPGDFLARISAAMCGLRVRLLLLVLLAGLPSLSLIVVTAIEQRASAEAAVMDDALRIARLAASTERRVIDENRSLLAALGRAPAIQSGDQAACSALLADILAEFPHYVNLMTVTPSGEVFCVGKSPVPASVADRPTFQRVLQTGRFAVSDYVMTRGSLIPSVVLAHPLHDPSGTLTGMLMLAIELDWMSMLASEADLPPDATFTVVDRRGDVIAHYPPDPTALGQPLPPGSFLKSAPLDQHEGMLHGPGPDGTPHIFAYTRLELPNSEQTGLAFVAIPTLAANAEVNRQFARNLTGLGVTAILAFVAVWIGGDVVLLRAMRQLVGASRRIAAGDLAARVGRVSDGGSEVVLLGAAFDQMAASLERREAERKRLLADLEHVLARRTALLNAATQRIEFATTTDGVFEWLVDAGRELTRAEHGWVLRWDEDRRLLVLATATSPEIVAEPAIPLGRCLGGTAAQAGVAVIDNEIGSGSGGCPTAMRAGMHAAIAVPMLHGGQILGVLVLGTSRPGLRFTDEDGRDLEILAADAASRLLAVERTQLFAVEATARELTHLINNDLALAVAPLDLMRDELPPGSEQKNVLGDVLDQIGVATARLAQLNRLVRFRTKQTPAGTSLDLGASARPGGQRGGQHEQGGHGATCSHAGRRRALPRTVA